MDIDINNVSFCYPGNKEGALKNFSIYIKQGECILLTGESGCGKTTVTRLINGLIPAFFKGKLTGEVLIDGKEISTIPSYELSKHVGSVFQNPRTQFFNVDTDSEIAFGMENAGVDSLRINKVLEKVTDEFELYNLRGRDIFELSGGEKQKIAFAGIYAVSPDIYVLDEPSSNLDREGIDELYRCLLKVKSEGKTIIIAEHRLYYLTELADRVIYMENGEIRDTYTQEEFAAFSVDELANLGLRTNRRKEPLVMKNVNNENSKQSLRFQNLSLYRNKKLLQDDLNLEIHPGEIWGFIGKNGVGKTTLLRTISGLHKEYKGNILINGKKLTQKELKRKAYMVMQDVNYQLFADSVEEECVLGINANADEIQSVLERLNLKKYKERHPNTLSGGQKQRLAVAVSMLCKKEILLFDEPTSGLDYKSMLRMSELITEMSRMNKYIIIVSHDEEFLNKCCTGICYIK